MPWSDPAVSPVTLTPSAAELALDTGLSVAGSKIVPAVQFRRKRDVGNPELIQLTTAKRLHVTAAGMAYGFQGYNTSADNWGLVKLDLESTTDPVVLGSGTAEFGGTPAQVIGHNGAAGRFVVAVGTQNGTPKVTNDTFASFSTITYTNWSAGFTGSKYWKLNGSDANAGTGTVLLPLNALPNGKSYRYPCVARLAAGATAADVYPVTALALGAEPQGVSVCALPVSGHFLAAFDLGSVTYFSKSTDDGITWTDIGSKTGTFYMQFVAALADGTVLFSDNNPQLYKSTDGGVNFSKVTTATTYATLLYSPTQLADSRIYVLDNGTPYSVRVSTDGGVNWSVVSTSRALYGTLYLQCNVALGRHNAEILGQAKDGTVWMPSIWAYNGKEALAATLATTTAFQPTSPAKLATLPQATLTLDTTGAAGTVDLYLQHYNDEVARWESYAGVADAWTLAGTATANGATTFDLATLPARAGEKVRIKTIQTSTAGLLPAPAIVSVALTWTSDVTAPAAPTISAITSVAPTGGQVGYRVDFGALPTGARHFIVEGQLNSGAWLPFSAKATWVAGTSYMRFRGALDAVEAAGERNERHLSSTGFVLGDIVSVRVAAEDDVGNRSAFTVSDALTIAGATYIAVPASSIRLSLRSSRLTLRLR